MSAAAKPRLALALGDPAGIGSEIVLKTLADDALRAAIQPIVVGDAAVLAHQATALGLPFVVGEGRLTLPAEGWSCRLLDCGAAAPAEIAWGIASAAGGRAVVAYAKAAVALALAGEADAVLAAPHTERAVAMAGIPFSGYPDLVAAETGTPAERVFLMLVAPGLLVVNATLHIPLAEVPAAITPARVAAAIHAAEDALRMMGRPHPRVAVCGLNPHAGEGGLFGSEDEAVIRPTIARCRAEGIDVSGPYPADALLADHRHDVHVAMFHDQAHVAVKVAAPRRSTALSIGTPILFGTVAHGSAYDIAGRGTADPTAFRNATGLLAEHLAAAPARA
jgi:4-hydroxythreonine-4-phosphate dehydrogenase